MLPQIGGLLWGAIAWQYGRKWLFNWIDFDVLVVDPADPAMAEAIERARGSLGVLRNYLDQDRHQCFVKFPLETKGGRTEYIWGIVHSRLPPPNLRVPESTSGPREPDARSRSLRIRGGR